MDLRPIAMSRNHVYDGERLLKIDNYVSRETDYRITSTGGINVILLFKILNIPVASLGHDLNGSTEQEFLYKLWIRFVEKYKNNYDFSQDEKTILKTQQMGKELIENERKGLVITPPPLDEDDITQNKMELNAESPVFFPKSVISPRSNTIQKPIPQNTGFGYLSSPRRQEMIQNTNSNSYLTSRGTQPEMFQNTVSNRYLTSRNDRPEMFQNTNSDRYLTSRDDRPEMFQNTNSDRYLTSRDDRPEMFQNTNSNRYLTSREERPDMFQNTNFNGPPFPFQDSRNQRYQTSPRPSFSQNYNNSGYNIPTYPQQSNRKTGIF